MNREECIKILKKATNNHTSFLEDNRYRYKMANINSQYDDVIKSHTDELDKVKAAFKHLEDNLK